jgi:hypothetical protein
VRRQFGTTAAAGAKAGFFGLRGVIEKTAILALGRFDAAYGSAIYAGGSDAGEKAAVKARVPGFERQVATVLQVFAGCSTGVLCDCHAVDDTPQAEVD